MQIKSLRGNVLFWGLTLSLSACVSNTHVLGSDDETGDGASASGSKPGRDTGGGTSAAGGGASTACKPSDCGERPELPACEGGNLISTCESKANDQGCEWTFRCSDPAECQSKGGVCTVPGLEFPPNYTQIDAGCPGSADVCWVPVGEGSGGGGSSGGGTGAGAAGSGAGGSNGGDTGAGAAGSGAGGSGANGGMGGDANVGCSKFRVGAFGCNAPASDQQLVCFTSAELRDPCAGTHLKSVDPDGGAGAGAMPQGDGGTKLCPSADELVWGDAGETCGCFDVPACMAPTTEQNGACCYPANHLCRLC